MKFDFHFFANPARFVRLCRVLMPILAIIGGALLMIGLYGGLVSAPADYLQGDAARIMYVHVPSAWMSMFVYMVLAASSAGYLIWRHPVADVLARGASMVGAAFTAVALVTGMLWGLPSWGAAWVWDARLTSVLVLFFLYVAHMIFVRSFDDVQKSSRFGAVLALIGIVNLPIIKYSVEWWNTLHQPSSISTLSRLRDPAIDPSMLWPLLVMGGAFLCLAMLFILMAARGELAQRRIYMNWQRGVGHG